MEGTQIFTTPPAAQCERYLRRGRNTSPRTQAAMKGNTRIPSLGEPNRSPTWWARTVNGRQIWRAHENHNLGGDVPKRTRINVAATDFAAGEQSSGGTACANSPDPATGHASAYGGSAPSGIWPDVALGRASVGGGGGGRAVEATGRGGNNMPPWGSWGLAGYARDVHHLRERSC